MTIAGSVINLALRNAGVSGVGQTPDSSDTGDALVLLNDMIGQWNVQRTIMNIPGVLATFPDLVTDVPSWTGNENVLLTTLSVRLRSAYGLPKDDIMVSIAEASVGMLQANDQRFVPALHAGVPTTVIQLIYLALRLAGRINDQQSVSDSSKEVNDALVMLSLLDAQWQRRRWLVPDLVESTIVSTGGATYTVGPAQQIAMTRPAKIQSAFARLLTGASSGQVIASGQLINNGGVVQVVSGGSLPTSPAGLSPGSYWNNGGVLMIVSGLVPAVGGPVDYPLQIIEAREDYNRIALKSQSTLPSLVFYDSGYPTGTLYVWPVPAPGAYELHLFTTAQFTPYATTADALNRPPEYLEALAYNLALRIPGGQPGPAVAALARAALNTIRQANAQIMQLQMPAMLPGRRPRMGSNYAAFVAGL